MRSAIELELLSFASFKKMYYSVLEYNNFSLVKKYIVGSTTLTGVRRTLADFILSRGGYINFSALRKLKIKTEYSLEDRMDTKSMKFWAYSLEALGVGKVTSVCCKTYFFVDFNSGICIVCCFLAGKRCTLCFGKM